MILQLSLHLDIYWFYWCSQTWTCSDTKKRVLDSTTNLKHLMDLHRNEPPVIPKQTNTYWSFLQSAQHSPAYTGKTSLQHLLVLVQKLLILDRRIWSLQLHSQKCPGSTRFLAAVSSSQLEHLLSLHLKSEPLVFCWPSSSLIHFFTKMQKCNHA